MSATPEPGALNSAAAHAVLLRLLFDQSLRESFIQDRDQTLAELAATGALDAAGVELFRKVDGYGLELDAAGRRRYLMSALCRSWPLTAGGIGAAGGPDALSAFLASPALFSNIHARTLAFGDHLDRLLNLNMFKFPAPALALLRATASLERALVENAAAARARPATSNRPPSDGKLKRYPLTLAPCSGVAVLPCSRELVASALDNLSAQDAWHRVASGQLEPARLISVARAEPDPVTVFFRAVVHGAGAERGGAGGLAPQIEVRHLTIELRGRRDAWLAGIHGQQRLHELPPAQQRLARKLVEAGLLTAGPTEG